MDHSGYQHCIKMEMVRRVQSHPHIWQTAELTLTRGRICVNIGEHGYFEAQDDALRGAGCIGLHLAAMSDDDHAALRNVVVQGTPALAPWNDQVRQPTNWFKPCPRDDQRWQMPMDLIKLPDGQLLLTYNVQADDDQSGKRKRVLLATRSSDLGRTWSDPAELELSATREGWDAARLHLTPAGRLIALAKKDEQFYITESKDAGQSFAETTPVNIPTKLEHMKFNVDNRGLDRDGNMDLTEVCGTQTGNGNIMALIRPVYSPWMWETWSKDGGITWGPCMRGPFPGYATPNMLRTESGAILVAHRQPTMSIHCSRDDGHSWDQGTLIDSGLWCMGAMREVEPDLVLYVYWDNFETDMRAQFIRVKSDRLEPVRRV